MKRKTSWRVLFPLLVAALMAAAPATAYADVVYWTNTRDKEDRLIWTQPAYTPIGTLGDNLATAEPGQPGVMRPSPLSGPKDLFIDAKDHLYVADTGNNRIVEFGPDGQWLRDLTVPESPLRKPEGVFVADSGDIYVADTGNRRVVKLTPEGRLAREYGRPESPYIPETFKYDPTRLVIDKRGFLYIAVLGGFQGLLQLDPEGKFQSFYGANKTPFSALDAFKRFVYTKEMYANEISKLPGAVSSVAMDRNGFLYTTTMGQDVDKNQIKRLNIRGLNMLDTPTDRFGETRGFDVRYQANKAVVPTLIDLAVDGNGNITAIDSSYNYINQYDANGNLLFFWAGPASARTTQLGLMKNPTAIDANSRNDLYILDSQDGLIQIFRLSEFGAKVNEANRLTLQGRYEESEKIWQEALRLNSNFTPAILGLAKAAYKQGDYSKAARLFREGEDRKGYSAAFWQIRLHWFQKHFSALASALLVGGIALALADRFTRRTRWRQAWQRRPRSTNPAAVQFRHLFHLLRHPLDGFVATRYENKGGYASATCVLLAVFVSLAAGKLYTGYTFNETDLHRFNLLMLLGQAAAVWLGWVVSNYLVSSIYSGEGRFKDVFVGSAYMLLPLVLVGLPLVLASMGMTESERAIYEFAQGAMYVWTLLLLFWMIQSTHNYSFGETIVNIVLTALTFVLLAVFLLLLIGLTNDLKDFTYEIYREATLR